MEMSDNTGSPTANPIWNTVLTYGGYCAGAFVVFSLVVYLTGFNVMNLSGIAVLYGTTLIISFIFATMAIRHQRDRIDDGYISYGRALLVGLLVVMAGVIVSGFWNYILVNFVDPNYVVNLKEQFVEAWGDKMPAEQLEEALAGFDKTGDFLLNLKNGVVGGLIFGLITGLITAAFLKKQPEMPNL
jgi:hypothetical protein